MANFVFVNGDYVPEAQAKISVFDRGFLFADAIYEVIAIIGGCLIDNQRHLERMASSLRKIDLSSPASTGEILDIQQELLERNGLHEGTMYFQISRGAGDRDFPYPENTVPSLIAFTQEKAIENTSVTDCGGAVKLLPEIRWGRRDIKTVGLLAQSMAKQAAINGGANDAWFVENGFITEGASSNAFIVKADGTLVTRGLSNSILPGITRQAILDIAAQAGMQVEERPISAAESLGAAEAFSTSASTFVVPVVQIDEHTIGSGNPGAVTKQLRQLYLEEHVW